MLAEELRSVAKVGVEIYSPDSTDALMDRFNRILASMSVSEALKAQGSTAPARLLLVYDGRATGVREMQLLARLLKDFPGANTRVALLLHSHAEAGKKIEAFGKRMVRWDVQRPSAEESEALLVSAVAQGQGPEAQALLDYIGDQDEASRTMQDTLRVLARADAALASPISTATLTPTQPAAAATVPDMALAALTARASRPEPGFHEPRPIEAPMQVDPALAAAALAATQPKKRMPTILLVGLAALAASALLTVWQRLPSDQTKAKPPPTVAAVDTSASEPASPATSTSSSVSEKEPPASQLQDVKPAPFTSTPGEPIKGVTGPIPVPEDSDPATRLAAKAVSAAPPAPLPMITAPSPSPTAPSSEVTPPVSTATASSARLASSSSPAEMKTIPAGFYVQHMSSGEREVVESFWRRNPSLRQARLIELTRIGAEGPNFVLLSGPFPTLTQARTFMSRPGLPKDMWVREASKIRPLLPASR
jgi:hypothetical protein